MKMHTATLATDASVGRMSAGNTVVAIAPPATVGPSRMPARISPTTCGWPTFRASNPTSRAAVTMTTSANTRRGTSAAVTLPPPPAGSTRTDRVERDVADAVAEDRAAEDPDDLPAVLDVEPPAPLGQLPCGQ